MIQEKENVYLWTQKWTILNDLPDKYSQDWCPI